jgi:hypothetical protein
MLIDVLAFNWRGPISVRKFLAEAEKDQFFGKTSNIWERIATGEVQEPATMKDPIVTAINVCKIEHPDFSFQAKKEWLTWS